MSEEEKKTFLKTGIGPITDKFIDTCLSEINKKQNRDKLYNSVVNPIIETITQRFYPFVITVSLLYILVLILILIIIYLIMAHKKNSS